MLAPPSRRDMAEQVMGEQAGDGLTPTETAKLRKLAGTLPAGVVRIEWQPGAPTPPEVFEKLGPHRHPVTNMPVGRDYIQPGQNRPATRPLELPAARAEREFNEKAAFSFWAGLSTQAKSQLCADAANAREPHLPMFLVTLVAIGNAPDAGVPPLCVRAVTGADAIQKYQALCGITSFSLEIHQFVARPYVPAEGGAAC
jgi:hypothetical protein